MLTRHFITAAISATLLMAMPIITSAHDSTKNEAKNKAVVLAFLDTMVNQRNVDKALDLYVGDEYIQHNPGMPTGKEASRQGFKAMMEQMKDASMSIKRVIAEGDLVVTHAHGLRYKGDRGIALMDMFRLEKGKIVEHWDVIQEIPEVTKNSNTMF